MAICSIGKWLVTVRAYKPSSAPLPLSNIATANSHLADDVHSFPECSSSLSGWSCSAPEIWYEAESTSSQSEIDSSEHTQIQYGLLYPVFVIAVLSCLSDWAILHLLAYSMHFSTTWPLMLKMPLCRAIQWNLSQTTLLYCRHRGIVFSPDVKDCYHAPTWMLALTKIPQASSRTHVLSTFIHIFSTNDLLDKLWWYHRKAWNCTCDLGGYGTN